MRTDIAPQGVALGWANGSAFGRKTSRKQMVDCDIIGRITSRMQTVNCDIY
jgi:hypothetical protein